MEEMNWLNTVIVEGEVVEHAEFKPEEVDNER